MNVNTTWPFHDETSGYSLQEHLFYGFGDSGSMAGADFPTREAAINHVLVVYDYNSDEIGTKPDELGEYAVTVMSGREFVEECFKRGLLDENGTWVF